MKPLNLPNVAAPMHPVILGTMTFGSSVDLDTSRAIVDAYVAAGGNALDTANVYGEGETERILSQVIEGRRDEFVLATKVGMPTDEAAGRPLLHPEVIAHCVKTSLARLHTDRVEVLYLHKPDRDTAIEETLGAVKTLVDAGTVLSWGVSNYAAWQIQDLMRVAGELGLAAPVLSQQMYNAISAKLDDEYTEFAATHQLPTVVYNPLAGGMLTGRYESMDVPATGRFGSYSGAQMYRDRYWNENVFAALGSIKAIADGLGMGMPELAIRWLLSRDVVGGVIIGGSSLGNIQANLDALASGPLPADAQAAVTEVTEAMRGAMPNYNR